MLWIGHISVYSLPNLWSLRTFSACCSAFAALASALSTWLRLLTLCLMFFSSALASNGRCQTDCKGTAQVCLPLARAFSVSLTGSEDPKSPMVISLLSNTKCLYRGCIRELLLRGGGDLGARKLAGLIYTGSQLIIVFVCDVIQDKIATRRDEQERRRMARSIIIIPNTNLIINGTISRSALLTKDLPKAELSGAARR